MYIRKEDYRYLEILFNGLDRDRKKRFFMILSEAVSSKAGEEFIEKIKVVGEEILGERSIDSHEWITKTMIKKAYKESKK